MQRKALDYVVLEKIQKALTSPVVSKFVREAFIHQYSHHFAPRHKEASQMIIDAFDILEEAASGPSSIYALKQMTLSIPYSIFRKNEPTFWFNRMYSNYKKLTRAQTEYYQTEKYLTGQKVLDFGSGSGWFAAELVQHGYIVHSADVLDYRIPESIHIPFQLMRNPTDIDETTEHYDTITIKSVLHHIEAANLIPILKALSKIGKRFIIEEDTYGFDPKDKDTISLIQKEELLSDFIRLKLTEQLAAISLGDFVSNIIVSGHFEMNMPFAFHTLNEWEKIFTNIGVKKITTIKLGIEPDRVTPICRGLIIVEL